MKKSDILGLCLLAFVIGCRFFTPLADFYAGSCYPYISAGLSRCASFVPFSLEEVVVIGFAVAFIAVLVIAIKRKEGFRRWFGKTARIAMWLVVWFYMGWGNNYYRTPLYSRLGIHRTAYDEETFIRFLEDYTKSLNAGADVVVAWDKDELEADVRDYYSTEVAGFGYTALRPWQHVKKPLLNPVYPAVGVLGYMGPFLCEAQLNLDIPDIEYPFHLAHEMAHLAGVTSEAEANYWAYEYCRRSDDMSVRYSGHLALLSYVAGSADYLLSDEESSTWVESLSDAVVKDYSETCHYWEGKRVALFDDIQYWMMDLFLRSNGVGEGAKDYSGVIGILMTMDEFGASSRKEAAGALAGE
jgi:hypothetical protein